MSQSLFKHPLVHSAQSLVMKELVPSTVVSFESPSFSKIIMKGISSCHGSCVMPRQEVDSSGRVILKEVSGR